MPEMVNVVADEPIEASWGNAIRDRTLQRYDDAATRTSEHGSPNNGDLSFLENTGVVSVYFGGWREFVPAGVILPYGGATAPGGYLLCQGQEVSRSTFAALFNVLGTAYGAGNGTTTFNVPDMRQRFPLGKADSGTGNTLGGTGGSINHSHSNPTTSTVGNHTHTTPTTSNGSYNSSNAFDHSHAQGNTGSASGTTGSGGSHSHSFFGSTGGASSGTSHTHGVGTLQPTDSAGSHSHSGPSHSHTNPNTAGASGATPLGGAGLAGLMAPVQVVGHTHTMGNTGGSGSHSHTQGNTGTNNPPYLVMNFIVKT